MNNRKTEEMAARAVEESIEKVDRLGARINRNDKTPSWDGDVYVHQKSDDSKKGILKIPIQVKGKTYKNNYKKKFSVEIADLENYLNDKGCVYFLVYINEADIDERHICYSVLTPLEIKRILKETKKGQKHKIIHFKEFPDDIEKKLNIFINFHENQGLQRGFINKDIYSVDKLKGNSVQNIVITPNGGQDNAKEAFFENDYCMYANIKVDINGGEYILFPLYKPGPNTFNHHISNIQNKKISINDREFYSYYIIQEYKNSIVANINTSLSIIMDKHTHKIKISYKDSTSIRTLEKDLEFMLLFIKNGYFEIDGQKICFKNDVMREMGKQLNAAKKEKELMVVKNIINVLDKFNCKEDINVFNLTQADIKTFNNLKKLNAGEIIWFKNVVTKRDKEIVIINAGLLNFKMILSLVDSQESLYKIDEIKYIEK